MSTATIEKPKAKAKTDAKAPAVTPESWSRIDSRAKPSKAVSRDGMRPALTCGYIRHEKTASYLYATDSYMLVALPITMEIDGTPEERAKVLPEVGLIRESLQALDKAAGGEFRIVDGLVEVKGDPALFRVNTEYNPPNFRELLGGKKGLHTGDSLTEIGFNPNILKALCEALGAKDKGVSLSFVGPLRPIKVQPLNRVPGEAIMMPIRTTV